MCGRRCDQSLMKKGRSIICVNRVNKNQKRSYTDGLRIVIMVVDGKHFKDDVDSSCSMSYSLQFIVNIIRQNGDNLATRKKKGKT